MKSASKTVTLLVRFSHHDTPKTRRQPDTACDALVAALNSAELNDEVCYWI
jgi:hypothetical protein